MHQQLWGYKVELKSVSRGTGGKKVEYHCCSLYDDAVKNYKLINIKLNDPLLYIIFTSINFDYNKCVQCHAKFYLAPIFVIFNKIIMFHTVGCMISA